MVTYDITDEGLVFTADEETRKDLQVLRDKADYVYAEDAMLEYALSNGLNWVRADDIGALTSAPILSDCCPDDDDSYPPDARFWWFERYQIEDPIDTLITTGRVVFPEAH